MEWIGLDKTFCPVKTLNCLNVQWNRRYYEAGEYQLQLRAADFDDEVVYVYCPERPETGMVEKIETQHTVQGDFVLVSGLFLEGMFNWKVVHPRWMGNGIPDIACWGQMLQHMGDVGLLVPERPMLGAETSFDFHGVLLGQASYGLLKLQGLSQRIGLDIVKGTITYEIWRGFNRTQSQTVNPSAVFGQSFGNVDALLLTRDTSALRNYAVAAYNGGVVTVDARTSASEPLRVLYVDTGLAQSAEQTLGELISAVDTAARTELDQYVSILNLEATTLQGNLRYRADYDLGDLCDIRDDRLNLAYEARIIEVDEVWQGNAHTVELQFGNKIPENRRNGLR